MEHGFEFVAAKPKKAADDEPYAENMRGDRKITKNPSTDQKKVRRAQQRKSAMEASVEYPEDIEIEAGIRDWFQRLDNKVLPQDFLKHPTQKSDFDPLGQSGLPGYGKPDYSDYQAPAAPDKQQYRCPQCQGSAQGFSGEPCPSCRGTGMRIDASKTANLRCPQCDSWSLSDKPSQCADCKVDMVPEQGHPDQRDKFKAAALDDMAGNKCRLCEGNMNPVRSNGITTSMKCDDCGTTADVQKKAVKSEMNFLSAIAKRAQSVLDTPEGEL